MRIVLAGAILSVVWACGPPPREVHLKDQDKAVSIVLDDFHDAAAKADFKRYFNHFARNGVFLGTDATERWNVEEFKNYARPHFRKGKGWTFTAVERFVSVSVDQNTAWFDERLSSKSYGECRGSGVLIRSGESWKLAQYNLTIPIPNKLARKFVKMIRDEE